MSRNHLFLLFWYTAIFALHFRARFSAVPQIIQASQVLPKNATVGFGQVFPDNDSHLIPFFWLYGIENVSYRWLFL